MLKVGVLALGTLAGGLYSPGAGGGIGEVEDPGVGVVVAEGVAGGVEGVAEGVAGGGVVEEGVSVE